MQLYLVLTDIRLVIDKRLVYRYLKLDDKKRV